MDLRVLRYFLTVSREQSFTKAAIQLHITQPTLSRQLAALEAELGTVLLNRNGHNITLTNDGILLKRRALEIISLEDKIMDEFKDNSDEIIGTVTIGCGEFAAVEMLAQICAEYKQKYPLVQIAIHTGTADVIYEMMNKGLVDIGMFLEPVSVEGLEYIRMRDSEHYVVSMRADDPLANKEYLNKDDLLKLPLILPERQGVRDELANWFGEDYDKIKCSFISNLGTNAGIMIMNGLGYSLSVEGAMRYWDRNVIAQIPIYPQIYARTVIAWRRNIPYSVVVKRFIEKIKESLN